MSSNSQMVTIQQQYLNTGDETELALAMLARTRELLEGGERWRGDNIAAESSGSCCDPLASKAYYFSLVGAAARARWELREELAQASAGEMIRVVDILRAMSMDQHTSYTGPMGWRHIETTLNGLENAVREYRYVQTQ